MKIVFEVVGLDEDDSFNVETILRALGALIDGSIGCHGWSVSKDQE